MPAIQRGQAYKLGVGKWGLRYYDENGVRRRKSAFPSKSAALAHYRDFIEPRLLGEPEPPEPGPSVRSANSSPSISTGTRRLTGLARSRLCASGSATGASSTTARPAAAPPAPSGTSRSAISSG
jgi:hypothetical protein